MSLFITGTGTGVGKTVVTAGLSALLKSQQTDFCVYKPIQTGSANLDEPEDPGQIKHWLGENTPTYCTYNFFEPAAPYVVDDQRIIDPRKILTDFKALQKTHSVVLVEGAGGVRVPVARHFEMIDLIWMLQLPVIVVASPFLGTINHTLLTVESLILRRIEVRGVVISGYPDNAAEEDRSVSSLLPTLETFLPVPVLGLIPNFCLTNKDFEDSTLIHHFRQLNLF